METRSVRPAPCARGRFPGIWRFYDSNDALPTEIDLDGEPCKATERLQLRHDLRIALMRRLAPTLVVPEVEGAAAIRWQDLESASVSPVPDGLLSKSSSARYSLRMRSNDVERLTGLLSAVASAKNATVDRLEWRYPEGEEAKQRWLHIAVVKARRRAEAMASALGVTLDGVKRVTSPITSTTSAWPGPHSAPGGAAYGSVAVMRRAGAVDLGVEVAPTKRIEVDVRIELTARVHRA